MRPILPTFLAIAASAQATTPPPDTLPGTVHFDSGSTKLKAKPGKKHKHVRHTGNAVLNKTRQGMAQASNERLRANPVI